MLRIYNRQLFLLAWQATVHWAAESDMTEGLSAHVHACACVCTSTCAHTQVMKGIKTVHMYLDYITGCSGTVNQYREKRRKSKFY